MRKMIEWAAVAVLVGCGGGGAKPTPEATPEPAPAMQTPPSTAEAMDDDGIRPGTFPCGACRARLYVAEPKAPAVGVLEVQIGEKAADAIRKRGIERLSVVVKSAEGVSQTVELNPAILADEGGVKVLQQQPGLTAEGGWDGASTTLVVEWSEAGAPARSEAPVPAEITVPE